MIIDTHTHFYDPTRPEGVAWPPMTNELLYRTVLPADFRAVAEPAGVTATVVVEASPRPADNQWILDLAAADPSIVGYVGNVAPNRPEFATEVAQWAENDYFCGIRCGNTYFADVTAGRFLADMATLVEHDLQLDVLIREENFAGLSILARELPELRIVVDHIGHMPIDGQAIDPRWVEHYQQLATHPNITVKVSALLEQSTVQPAPTELDYYRPTLDLLWTTFGAARLFYGSNWPVLERAGTYGTAFRLVQSYWQEKGDAAVAQFFWQNAQSVYRVAAS